MNSNDLKNLFKAEKYFGMDNLKKNDVLGRNL